LLDLFQELAGFAVARVQVEGEQRKALGGNEVPVAILPGDQPEMEASDLASHLAQPGAFRLHVGAQLADGGLLVAVFAFVLGEFPGGLGQAFFQELDLAPEPGDVGFEPLVLFLDLSADAIGFADDPAVYPQHYGYGGPDDCHERGERRQPGVSPPKGNKPFPNGFERCLKCAQHGSRRRWRSGRKRRYWRLGCHG
jgi:hypothetical protein